MKQKRKFLLVLPLLTLPFLTFAFWALGGGRGTDEVSEKNAGLNVELPGANLKDEAVDKLGYYDKAAADSAHLRELEKNDPYYKSSVIDNDTLSDHSMESILPPARFENVPDKKYVDPNEAKVYKKLEQLNNIMKANDKVSTTENNPVKEKPESIQSVDVDRLEQMMKSMSGNDNADDPEMKQLNGMMEKILDIQHPERVKEKIKVKSIINKEQVFAVTPTEDENISLLEPDLALRDTVKPDTSKAKTIRDAHDDDGFYSFNEDPATETHNSIEAVIHQTQTVVTGSPVKLRLADDVYINGILIPKDNFVFGTASLTGERLKITVHSIRYQNSLLPVDLSIYDIDGMEGIYIPGAISRDVAKQSADNALQNINVNSIDPSVGTQALGMGIEAGKNLLSKKAKLIRVTVKAGYKVLLKDNNNK